MAKRISEILKNITKKSITDNVSKEIKKSYDIREIFEQMELDLISSMRRAFYFHQSEQIKEGFKWEQWQLTKLREIEKFRKRNKKIIGSYSKPIQETINREIGDSYNKGQNKFKTFIDKIKGFFRFKSKSSPSIEFPDDIREVQTVRDYISKELGRPSTVPPETSFFGVNKKKLEALISTVNKDLTKAQYSVLRKMDDVYRQTIFKSHVYLQNGAKTLNQAIDMATRDFLNKGINSIIYKDGKRVNIASYAEMCLRTANHRATLLGEGSKRDEYGIHLVVVSAHLNTCEMCEPWQSKVLIDDVFSHPSKEYIEQYKDKYKLLSQAIDEGFLHPNCRHTITTYFPGITQIPQVQDGEEAIKNYKAEQKQRAYERAIRKQKRIVEGTCDEQKKKEEKLKLSGLQRKLREHLEKNPILKRNYEREKIDFRSITEINYSKDLKQFGQYKEILKEEAPKSLKEFQELKYNNSEEWTKLKENFKIVDSYKVDFGYVSPKKILELDKLAFEAKRNNQISKYKKQGNFAVLEYNGNIKFASSKINKIDDKCFNKYKGDKDKLVLLKENRIFKTKDIGEIVDNKINEIPRYYDTEAKFFEFLEDQMKIENIKEIFMLSEKAMCESCREVAKQFIKKYPEVKINIVSGKTFDGWKGR